MLQDAEVFYKEVLNEQLQKKLEDKFLVWGYFVGFFNKNKS